MNRRTTQTASPKDALPLDADWTAPRILIADDQPDILMALQLLFRAEGYQTESVTSPVALLEALWQNLRYVVRTLSQRPSFTHQQDFLDRLKARVEALPGVEAVTLATGIPPPRLWLQFQR